MNQELAKINMRNAMRITKAMISKAKDIMKNRVRELMLLKELEDLKKEMHRISGARFEGTREEYLTKLLYWMIEDNLPASWHT